MANRRGALVFPVWMLLSSICYAEGTQALSANACSAAQRFMQRTELIFGTARRGHSPISDTQWTAFAQRELSRRFPDGWTLVNANGQWRGAGGKIVRERSHIFIVLHDGAPDVSERIETVRALYEKRFAQESVLRIDSPACVSF